MSAHKKQEAQVLNLGPLQNRHQPDDDRHHTADRQRPRISVNQIDASYTWPDELPPWHVHVRAVCAVEAKALQLVELGRVPGLIESLERHLAELGAPPLACRGRRGNRPALLRHATALREDPSMDRVRRVWELASAVATSTGYLEDCEEEAA